jgi:hypothetical protein
MKRFTHGFRIEKMRLDSSFRSDWEVPPLSFEDQQEIFCTLSQSFRYLDRGAQCYVFESEDSLYVLKLFRFDQPQNPLRKFFRTKIRKRSSDSHNSEKISHLFSACKLAYTLARQETELLYLHLNLTKDQWPTISLKTPLGKSLSLPLDSYRFALQKKAEPLKKVLLSSLSTGEIQMRLDAILALLTQRVAKGIGNSDRNLFRNFGFIEKKAVEIDFGNYGYSPDLASPSQRVQEVGRFISSLRAWLQDHAPEWVAYLDQKMEQV